MAGKATQEGDRFTAEERAALKERGKEARAAKAGKGADQTAEVLEKIAGFRDGDRRIAQRLHEVIMAAAPELAPRLWYGMPAYALNGQTICHVKDSAKFKERFCTLGFSDKAQLDDGAMWPKEYAVLELTDEVERRVAALITRAVGR